VSLEIWDKLKVPPDWALKPIAGGSLKGKTDINPQWRYMVMTEQFGPCGVGWKFEKVKQWTEQGDGGQVFAFVDVNLYIKIDGKWSEPIPANGGDMLIEKDKNGLHHNDEAFKMATTDALGTAMKMIGVAASVYTNFSDTKYQRNTNTQTTKQQPTEPKQDVYACESCKKSIPQGVQAFSIKKYGKSLCQDCQKKAVSA